MSPTPDLLSQLMNLSDIEIIRFFFKLFSVVFGFLYLVYTIILVRQTSVLNDTLTTGQRNGINLISIILLIVGIAAFGYAIFIL